MTAYTAPGLDRWLDPSMVDGMFAGMEAKESSIKDRIESSPSELREAFMDRFDSLCKDDEGSGLMTGFAMALCGAEMFVERLLSGEPFTDRDFVAIRELKRQIVIAIAQRETAVGDAVEMELAQ